MKKIIIVLAVIAAPFLVSAQEGNFDPLKDRQFLFDSLNICAILLVVYLIASFILRVIRLTLDFRLKNKIIDKGTGEPVVAQLLHQETDKKRNPLLQWFFVLAAIGIGFLLMHFTRPFGLHSLAIMAFSMAAGLGGYYYFSRPKENEQL